MTFKTEDREQATSDAVNLAHSRTISPALVAEQLIGWHELSKTEELGTSHYVEELARQFALRLYDMLTTANELAGPEKWSDINGPYRLVARGNLAADYALSRLMQLIVRHISDQDTCIIDDSPQLPSQGASAVIINRRLFNRLTTGDDDAPRQIGECWWTDDSGALHVRSTQRAEPSEKILMKMDDQYGYDRHQARQLFRRAGLVALQPFISTRYIDEHRA